MNRNYQSNEGEEHHSQRDRKYSDERRERRSSKDKDDKTEEKSTKAKDWSQRPGKNPRLAEYQQREDEEIIREHLEQMEKKQTFDFSNLKNVDLKVTYQGRDINEGFEFHRFEEIPYVEDMLKSNLKKMSFSLMTPIQKAVMSYLFKGHDVMGCSQTGSGKTLAFLLPIINKMLKDGPPEGERSEYGARPVTLILVPTRELADQIFKEARKILHKTGINIVKVYGGVSNMSQSRELRNGCDILVAAPGRLLDFLRSRDVTLSQVKYLILDEADRMLDMGFEPQLKSIIYEFDLCDKGKRQNLMFSATFEPEVKEIARKFMNEFYFVHTNTEMRASQNVTQVVIYAKESEKVLQLHKVLQTVQGSIIIFLDTKRGVENLNSFLDKSNYNCIAIHGDKKQWQRQDAIKKFTAGDVPILIATDVASRGLDFPKVSYVFNFDLPSNIDDYVHRIGRTGRGGDKGTAISFVNENNKNIIKPLYRILNELHQEIPDWFKKMFQECANYVNPNPKDRFKKDNFGGNDFLNKKRFNDYGGGNRFGRDQSGFNRDNNYGNQNSRVNSAWDKPQTSSSTTWDRPQTSSTSAWDKPQASTSSSGWDKPPITNFGSDLPNPASTNYNGINSSYPNSQWNQIPGSNGQQINAWRSETSTNNGISSSNNNWPVNPSFNLNQFPNTQGFSDLPRFPYPNPIPTSLPNTHVALIPNLSYPTRETIHVNKDHASSYNYSSYRHTSIDDRESSNKSRERDNERKDSYQRDRDRDRDRDGKISYNRDRDRERSKDRHRDYDRKEREKRSEEERFFGRDRSYDRRRDDDRKREYDKKKSSWRDEEDDRDNRRRRY